MSAPLINEQKLRLGDFPPPRPETPGWYPDPLGSAAERYWDGAWLDLVRASQLRLPAELHGNGARKRIGIEKLRVPLLGRDSGFELPALRRSVRDQRAREKAREEQLMQIEARKQAFLATPAGKARLAFGRELRLFQYELGLRMEQPILIPGPKGSPPRHTTDPVDVLNSVVAEGWKLVKGSYFYGEWKEPVGCYLFKRSKKRRQAMNDPWDA